MIDFYNFQSQRTNYQTPIAVVATGQATDSKQSHKYRITKSG